MNGNRKFCQVCSRKASYTTPPHSAHIRHVQYITISKHVDLVLYFNLLDPTAKKIMKFLDVKPRQTCKVVQYILYNMCSLIKPVLVCGLLFLPVKPFHNAN